MSANRNPYKLTILEDVLDLRSGIYSISILG